jgi:ABC-2 type transport system permease protein
LERPAWSAKHLYDKLPAVHNPANVEKGTRLSAEAPSTKRGTFGALAGSLATFYERRWLIKYLAQRQMARGYQGSYLGFVWALLSPLLMVALLTVIFSEVLGFRFREVAGDSALNYGLFLYCGLIPFLNFSDSMNMGVNIVRKNKALVKGVVFPLEILPLASVISSLIQSMFGVGAVMLVLAALEHRLNWTVLLLPLVVVPQLLFTLGLCYLMAVTGTYLPDLREALKALVRVSFFVTPIIWPVSRVPEDWRFLVDYNPLAVLVETYRDLILEGTLPGNTAALYFSLVALVLFAAGFVMFNRVKHNFADLL